MTEYGRRIVVDLGFEAAIGELSRAIGSEGLAVIARIDIRDHFWRDLRRDVRPYVLLDAWSPESAFEALRHEPQIGAILPTRFAIYELADGKTAVAVGEPFSPVATAPEWRRDAPALASIADQERERGARVLARLRHAAAPGGSVAPIP